MTCIGIPATDSFFGSWIELAWPALWLKGCVVQINPWLLYLSVSPESTLSYMQPSWPAASIMTTTGSYHFNGVTESKDTWCLVSISFTSVALLQSCVGLPFCPLAGDKQPYFMQWLCTACTVLRYVLLVWAHWLSFQVTSNEVTVLA